MEEETKKDTKLSVVLIALFRGVVYANENPTLWQDLINLQAQIRDYVVVLGLELVLHEDEGYAWLTMQSEEDSNNLPRMVAKRQLSYPVSLLLALLRKRLAEHDASSSEARLVLDRDEIIEMLKTFLQSGTNEAKIIDQIDSYIRKIIDLGFARRLKTDNKKIEVRRILIAFVNAEWAEAFDSKLLEYSASIKSKTEE